jgi:hypothetical protein
MVNQNKRQRKFQPGDLVIVRKQVNSKAAEGKPAKLTLKVRGPYRILEEAGTNAYWIQKLPAVQSLAKRPGKRRKELSMRMEKLPSSMVIHKRVATLDSRLAEMEGDLVSNLLKSNLGFYDFGKYTTAPGDAEYSFEKINELWDEELQAELNSDDEAYEGRSEDSELEEMEANVPYHQQAEEKETKQTKGNRKRLKRKQNDETNMEMTEKRAKTANQGNGQGLRTFLKTMWTDIQESIDKLYII